ncbi:hypothetical protein CR513_49626, partial [Mucuna pruriens]
MDMVMSMLSNSPLLVSLLMYALKIVMYLLNRIHSKLVTNTLFELWTGKELDIRHLHVWGCEISQLAGPSQATYFATYTIIETRSARCHERRVKIHGTKWCLRSCRIAETKHDSYGSLDDYKARLVAKGFTYKDIDMKTVFLNGDVEENVSGSKVIFLILYVDDILLATNDLGIFHETKKFLSSNFEIKDMGEASYVIRIEIF